MPATNVPRLKKILRGIKKSDAEAFAREVFRFDTAREVLEFVRAEIQSRWAEAYSLELPILTTDHPADAALSTPALGAEN